MAAQCQPNRWILKQTSTGMTIKIHEFEETTVGRHREAKVCLLSAKVSRNHARFGFNEDNKLWLKDLGSSNGTFVDGTCIEAGKLELVHHGAKIGFGLPSISESDGERDNRVFFELVQLSKNNDDDKAASSLRGNENKLNQILADVQNGGTIEFAQNKDEIIEISDEENADEVEKSKNEIINSSMAKKPRPSTSRNRTSIIEGEKIFDSFDDDVTKVLRKSNNESENNNNKNNSHKENELPNKIVNKEPLLVSLEKNIQINQEEEILQLSSEDSNCNQENDDSDNDITCSQIFLMSIEPEPAGYQKIKVEMAQMNSTDDSVILNPTTIYVNDDDDGFDNTQDLCAVLEEGLPTTSSPTLPPAPAECSTNTNSTEAPGGSTLKRKSLRIKSQESTDSTPRPSRTKRKTSLQSPEKKKLKTKLISPIANSSKRKHNSTSAVKEVKIPDLEEQLALSDSNTSKQESVSSRPKRNNRRSGEGDKAKKLKLDEQLTCNSNESKKVSMSKESKAKRKSSIEDSKDKASKEPKSKHRRSSVNIDKVKKPEPEKQLNISAGSTDSTKEIVSRQKRTRSIEPNVKKPEPEKSMMTLRSKSDLINTEKVSMEIYSSGSSTNSHEQPSANRRVDPRLYLPLVDIQTYKLPAPVYNLESNNEASLEKYKRRADPRFGTQIPLQPTELSKPINERQNKKATAIHNIAKNCNINNIIMLMLRWDPAWLQYQMETVSFEPRINSSPAEMVPLQFQNYSQYFSIFSKLILLETWESTKSYIDLRKSCTFVQVLKKRTDKFFMYLDCQYDINQKQFLNGEYCKQDDLIVVENKAETHSMTFGLVQNSWSSELPGKNQTNTYSVKFCVMISCDLPKYRNSLKKVIVQRVANLRTQLMLFKALTNVANSRLCSMLLNPKINDFKIEVTHEKILVQPDYLNSQQQNIVLEAASLCTGDKPGIYTLIGPPGTGKTHIIVNILFQIIFNHYFGKTNSKPPMILLVAPSNAAVDNLITKIVSLKENLHKDFKHKLKCVRIGPEASIGQEAKFYSLQNLATRHVPILHQMVPAIQDAKRRRVNMVEFCKQYFKKDYNRELRTSENLVIEKSNIILTTLGSCVSNSKISEAIRQRRIFPTCCIIDEATQCPEPESLLPTLLGIDKIVMVGDPRQLNATILSREASKLRFGESLFSRLVDNFEAAGESPTQMLRTQYRMHPEICSFPNRQFYEGKLRSQPNPKNRLPDIIKPYLVFNCTVPVSEDELDYTNLEEMRLIKKLLATIIRIVNNKKLSYTVGIITPYNAQKKLIHESLQDIAGENSNWKITINTVDSFQGSQNDIVIISCVRDSTNSFLQNVNRLNVALTRAQQALYIFGNTSLFTQCPPLYDLRHDAIERKLCVDINSRSLHIKDFSKYLCK